MSQEPLSAFYENLLHFLQHDLQTKLKSEGWDERFDPELCVYRDQLSLAIRSSGVCSLDEIIERYHFLFGVRGPVHLEHRLLEVFNDPELQRYKLALPRIVRGLPRLYHKSQPSNSRIKQKFTHLPSLKCLAAKKTIYSLYQSKKCPMDGKVVFFLETASGGLENFYAVLEVITNIRNSCPKMEMLLFATAEGNCLSVKGLEVQIWKGSEEQLRILRKCDVVVEFAAFGPLGDDLRARVEELDDPKPIPVWESVILFGGMEANEVHPSEPVHYLGLHFLERGMIFRSPALYAGIANLEHKLLTEWLFGQIVPGPQELEFYRNNRRFFLAKFYSEEGVFVYLHALLKSLEWDTKQVDLCCLNPKMLFSYFNRRLDEGKEPMDRLYKVGRLILHTESHSSQLEFGTVGKTLRIFCPKTVSDRDVQALLAFSEDFTACGIDQSFNDALSQSKAFFCDPSGMGRYFIKDLIALAKNRIPSHRSTLGILQLFLEAVSKHSSSTEWVEDSDLQQEGYLDLLQLAETMGIYLQDPDALVGFKKLVKILREEYCCNEFLTHLVQRALCHQRAPELARLEGNDLQQFSLGQQSFSQMIIRLGNALDYTPPGLKFGSGTA